MFMLPRSPFDEWPKWWTMTDGGLGPTRCAGTMEPLYWSPVSPVFEMSEAEAAKLPSRVVWFGTLEHIPDEMVRFVKPECRDAPFVLRANFEVAPSLRAKLAEVCALCREGVPKDAWDDAKVVRLLALQDECLALFATCAAESRQRAKAQ